MLFRSPGLADMADGGLGSRNAFRAMSSVIDGGQPIAVDRMMDSIDQIDAFVTDANVVLDQYDERQPKRDKMFVRRHGMRGLF